MTTAAGVRRPGAASLDLAYVAAGRIDGFWEFGLSPWDTAAGTLLIQEAGGRVGTPTGAEYALGPNIIAGNPKVYQAPSRGDRSAYSGSLARLASGAGGCRRRVPPGNLQPAVRIPVEKVNRDTDGAPEHQPPPGLGWAAMRPCRHRKSRP